MIDALTAGSIASTIRLLRDSHAGSIVLLEGDSDTRLFKKFTDPAVCFLVNAYNKENVLSVVQMLEAEGMQGVLGIVDADFWRLEGISPPSRNILVTDTHDLESMILTSRALENLLTELGSPSKIAKCEGMGSPVRAIILNGALPVGYIRWASLRFGLQLRFTGLNFSKFLNLRRSLAPDTIKLAKAVLDNSQKHDLLPRDLIKKMHSLMLPSYDPWQVVCGHDAVAVLSLSLKGLLGTNDAHEVAPQRLEVFLRLAYQLPYFQSTRLHASILQWQIITSFSVFAPN